ncbi:ATP-binding cassette domain-containing protein [Corynebacterium sp. sy017]|uniref:ABC transporter ATP-binding protein n=1 Tax=unclassified Corynebacterium TaxID=2624378 RepID=UPI0011849349|nr:MULTISPECIES: ATP-binding cassette domain-containing protein [unclassified Corynebacterium]MBP3088392.1 ATP-binding cassette domain-containing protein [Corynebacterium sp. sy017]QDZ41834.1 ATP-binding cassette domain-containing protein [Corynebacterium sp. sy039]TSD91706.1 ATP-binding cassette domain-containing protein [Corynebacterium sp. SY003]
MITFDHVSKSFKGREVLSDVSFEVPEGSITSLIGPNGSGKSTSLRILLQLETADSGAARFGDLDYSHYTQHARVGVSLDTMVHHPSRRAIDQMLWIAAAMGLTKKECYEKLDFVGLGDARRRRVKEFSLGMKQRLRIACALLGDPKVLILDEPVNGLDPEGIRWLREFLTDYCGQGNTVLITSHLMNELEQLATTFIFLNRGHIVEQVDRDTLRGKYQSLEQAYFSLTSSSKGDL